MAKLKYLYFLTALSITNVELTSDSFVLRLLRMDEKDFILKGEEFPGARNLGPGFISDLARVKSSNKNLNLKDSLMEEVWRLLLNYESPSSMSRVDWKSFESILGTLPQYVIRELNVSDPEIVEYFGSLQVLNFRQLATFGDLLKSEFGNYLFEDKERIMKLGNLLCGFNVRDLEKISSKTFRSLLNRGLFKQTGGCSVLQFRSLLNIAFKYTVVGPPAAWNVETVSTLGYLLAGLESKQVRQIRDESCKGISPETIGSIPSDVLLEMRSNQIASLKRKSKLAWRRKTKNTKYIPSLSEKTFDLKIMVLICLLLLT